MASPLADKLRPKTLEDVVGQSHLLTRGQVLRSIIDGGTIPNMIFYGPSGVGKTTVANIIASRAGKKLYRLNGTTASTADIKEIVSQLSLQYNRIRQAAITTEITEVVSGAAAQEQS